MLQGLIDFGFLNIIGFLFSIAFIQSGIILSFDQSPPPITFPALKQITDLSKDFEKNFLHMNLL